MHVAVDGKVIPCCHDYKREVLLGDVCGMDLDEILDSRQSTMDLWAARPDSLCRKCEWA